MTKLLSSAAVIALLLGSSAMALECPVPAAINDPASAAVVERVLPDGIDLDAPEALQSAVFELQQAGVDDDTILDNLISAYCNTLNGQQGLTDDEKAARIDSFTGEADNTVFSAAE